MSLYSRKVIAVGNMKFIEDETMLSSPNTGGDTSATSTPGFSLILNRIQHKYLAKDYGNLGQTLHISGPVFNYCLRVVR